MDRVKELCQKSQMGLLIRRLAILRPAFVGFLMNWLNCFVRTSCFNVSEGPEICSSVDKSAFLIISTILLEWRLFFLDHGLRGVLESSPKNYKINNEKMNHKKAIIRSNQFISLHDNCSLSMDYH